jgi:hypothetical protein
MKLCAIPRCKTKHKHAETSIQHLQHCASGRDGPKTPSFNIPRSISLGHKSFEIYHSSRTPAHARVTSNLSTPRLPTTTFVLARGMGEDILHVCIRSAMHPPSSACPQRFHVVHHTYDIAMRERDTLVRRRPDVCSAGIKHEAQSMAYTYFSKGIREGLSKAHLRGAQFTAS